MIATRPETADQTMRECAELGIKQVWIHRGPGTGSVSETATAYAREHGITVIDGGCPCMFGPTADRGQGQASGANNAIRELGGVFGVAILASIFAGSGGYGSSQQFVNGMTPAVYAGAAIVAVGALLAFAIGNRSARRTDSAATELAVT